MKDCKSFWIGYWLGVFTVTLSIGLAASLIKCFSPHEPGTQAHTSSSQPEELAQLEYLPSTVEIQRELNRRDPKLKLEEDGVCGRATQAAWDRACGDQYAIEFWPEEARIVE